MPMGEMPIPETDFGAPARDDISPQLEAAAAPKEAFSATLATAQEALHQQYTAPDAAITQQKAPAAAESFQRCSVTGWSCDPPEAVGEIEMFNSGGVYPEVDESKVVLLEARCSFD